MDVRKVDEDPEDELDKPGTTIRTKFSVLQIIRIPSLMRCGFLTIDPFKKKEKKGKTKPKKKRQQKKPSQKKK